MIRTASIFAATWALLSLYALSVPLKSNPQGDEPHYLMMTVSLIEDGDFDLSNNFKNRDFRAFTTWNLEPQRVQARDNRLVTAHEPGLPVLCALPYLLGGRTAVTFFLAAISALGILGIQHLTNRLTGNVRVAWIAAGILTVSLPWPMLGAMVFPDVSAAVMIVFALICIVSPRKTLLPSVMCTLLLIALPFFHTKYALFSLALCLMLLLNRRPSLRHSVILGIIVLVGTLGYFSVQMWIYGDPMFLFRVRAQGFLNPLSGILGTIWDREAGLLTFAPLFALAIPGGVILFRRSRIAQGIAVMMSIYIVMNASWLDWHGGHCPPARYLAPALPFLAMAAAASFMIPAQSYIRILAVIFGLLTIVQTLLLTLRVPESVIVRGAGHRMLWDGLPGWVSHIFPSMLNPEPHAILHALSLSAGIVFLTVIPLVSSRHLRYACLVAAASCGVILALTARSDFRFRTTLDATPLDKKPPELVSPELFSMHAGQFPDLVWRPVSGADGYRWHLIFPDGYQAAAETHRETRLDIPDSFTEAMPDGEYSWRVTPLKKGQDGVPSVVHRFRFSRSSTPQPKVDTR